MRWAMRCRASAVQANKPTEPACVGDANAPSARADWAPPCRCVVFRNAVAQQAPGGAFQVGTGVRCEGARAVADWPMGSDGAENGRHQVLVPLGGCNLLERERGLRAICRLLRGLQPFPASIVEEGEVPFGGR
jgi:hypothetical protein